MGWRTVVVASNSKVDYKMGYLIVRSLEQIRKVHLSEVDVLIVESTAASITAYALSELMKNKINIIFCDEKRNPQSQLLLLNGSYDAGEKIRRQINWTKAARQTVWTEIVREKIKNQRDVLDSINSPQSQLLTEYIAQLELNDATNREGHAAKVYFNALFGMEFARADDNSINAALNYGYAILLSAINREITAAGYMTQLGIFHDNTFNAFNLSCDFIEPLRPIVDIAVIRMMPEKFEHDEKMQLVNLLNTDVMVDGKKYTLSFAIGCYCKSLFNALRSGETEDIHFIKYEL